MSHPLALCERVIVSLQLPLDPLIIWMLSPAFIRACTSVVLLAPGITISADTKKTKVDVNVRSLRWHYVWACFQ